LVLFTICLPSFPLTLNDNGGISATPISFVVNVKSEMDILKAIQQANKQHIPIAIMGKQHSQGGQTLINSGIELNMLSFNKVLWINRQKKQVTVQSGIVWGDLQKEINPYNLAITSMQSPNIFTVGGSMSVNAHGDDFRAGSVGNSIIAFHILLANGKKVYVTPRTQPDLWESVIGGYGLLGVVTDVTLQLTDNNLLLSQYQETRVDGFPAWFVEKVLNDHDVALFYSHLNITAGSDFLRNMYVITYKDTHHLPTKVVFLDNPDKWNAILTPIFNISRHSNSGKKLRWEMERRVFKEIYNNHIVTRNNAMEKPLKFATDHHQSGHADWLQEYFIPLQNLPKFIQVLREVILKNNINVLNITIRSVPKESNLLLSYSTQRNFAVVIYFDQNLSKEDVMKVRLWTPQLIDAAVLLGGKYYLPYQPYATKKQFKAAYPSYNTFLKIKQRFDPSGIFNNKFYMKYLYSVRIVG
jgi:decaprenylphospho-beta-D-ribofuranose 2-oxidase